MEDRYIVICRDDEKKYRLTTRRTFNKKEAIDYIRGIAPEREPILVACLPNTVILRKEEL